MKIRNNIKNKSELLYDGLMSGIDKIYQVEAINKIITFNICDLEKNYFQDLLQNLNKTDMNRIIEEGEIKNTTPDYFLDFMSKEEYEKLLPTMQYYRSESHLGLNYLIKNNLLLLFTLGEKQPSRWILILEGIWLIDN